MTKVVDETEELRWSSPPPMAARRTRAAARRAALVPFLSELSDDEIEAIGYALADPLAPRLAVALSSCSRGLRRALAA